MKKLFLLSVAGIILLLGFFLLPRNREWGQKVIGYYKDYNFQKNRQSREFRMRSRFGSDYSFSKAIAAMVPAKAGQPLPVVLVPPSAYFKKFGMRYEVPEPAVFYYYTGCKTIAATSKEAIHADYYVRALPGNKFHLEKVTDRKVLQDTITALNKLK
jgi:hypothetical protein